MQIEQNAFSILLENIPEPAIIIDKDARILAINKPGLNISQYQKEEQTIYEIFPFNTGQFKKEYIDTISENKQVKHLEIENDTKIFKIEIYPLFDKDEIHCFLIFFKESNIMESSSLNTELINIFKKKYQPSIDFKTRTTVHDLNNVLTIIKNNIDVLPCDFQNKNIGISELKKAAKKACSLTENILSSVKDKKAKININSVINEVLLVLRPILTNIELDLKLLPDLQPVYANNLDIERIIINLLINSKEALSDGGVIVIKTETVNIENIDYICLSVSDNGRGIEKDIQEKIFSAYFTDKSESKKERGLGLTIVKSIVNQLAGFIKLESKPGEGTTFYIYIPNILQNTIINTPTYNTPSSFNTLFDQKDFYSSLKSLDIDGLSQILSSFSESQNFNYFLKNLLELFFLKNIHNQNLNILNKSKNKINTLKEIIFTCLINLARLRDTETGFHLERIGKYSSILAQELQIKEKYRGLIDNGFITNIYFSSQLHDIGKVGIADSILLKTESLTDQEYEIIKVHTKLGGDVIKEANKLLGKDSFLIFAEQIAYYHHEYWNGQGYMQGLKQEDIPLPARIVALADTYDACTTARVYKEAYSHNKTKIIIENEAGIKFDPDIYDAFLNRQSEFNEIREKYLE